MMVGHMAFSTRRQFLQTSAAVSACALMTTHPVLGSPLGLPLGLELYSVREMLPKDYAGTLKKVAALGYREVEAAGYFGHSAADVKAAMASAGLRCVSAHYSSDLLSKTLDEIIAFHKVLGAEYILCSYPGHKNPPAKGAEHNFTLEDWKWNTEQFNRWGAKVKAAGFRFGYHNHTPEFVVVDGVTPYDELMKLTDPALVTFEMDCGWVTVGGGNPVAYLHKYSNRISMLHVKDFKKSAQPFSPSAPPVPTELGRGTIDYRPIFAAAKKGAIKHCFVEQEGFDVPWEESLRIDADYLKAIKA
jgi:sugar phosphate isomerase/epimerase